MKNDNSANLRMLLTGMRGAYVRGLKAAAEAAGAGMLDYRLLEHTAKPLNPSGVLSLRPDRHRLPKSGDQRSHAPWRCPIIHAALEAESGHPCTSPPTSAQAMSSLNRISAESAQPTVYRQNIMTYC